MSSKRCLARFKVRPFLSSTKAIIICSYVPGRERTGFDRCQNGDGPKLSSVNRLNHGLGVHAVHQFDVTEPAGKHKPQMAVLGFLVVLHRG